MRTLHGVPATRQPSPHARDGRLSPTGQMRRVTKHGCGGDGGCKLPHVAREDCRLTTGLDTSTATLMPPYLRAHNGKRRLSTHTGV